MHMMVREVGRFEHSRLTCWSRVPGRVRWHVPELHRQPRRAATVEDAIRRCTGVLTVRVNPLTGSVLIHYDFTLISLIALESVVLRVLTHRPARSAAWEPRLDKRRRHQHAYKKSRPRDDGGCGGRYDLAVGPAWHLYLDATVLGGQLLRRFVLCACAALVAQPLVTIIMGVSAVVTGLTLLGNTRRLPSAGRDLSTNSIGRSAAVIGLFVEQNLTALAVLWLLHLGAYLRSVARRRSRTGIRVTQDVKERDIKEQDIKDQSAWIVVDGIEVSCPVDGRAHHDLIGIDAGEPTPLGLLGRQQPGPARPDLHP
jgi:cation transport ATPase